METFTLATVSLIISLVLIINKKKVPTHLSFASVCLAIFFYKSGAFFGGLLTGHVWKIIEYVGLIAIPPCSVRFTRSLLREQTFLTKRDVISATIFSFMLAVIVFSPLYRWPYLKTFLLIYAGAVLSVCYGALISYIRNRSVGVERTRMLYLAVACGAAAILSTFDIFHYYGYAFPPVSNLFIAILLYFVLILVTHPRLPELHELMGRALVLSIITLFATIIFTLIVGLFGNGETPPFTHILLASLIIVITIEPFKLVLKMMFSRIYPEGKEVFTSLYAFDELLEKEKSLLLEEMAPVLAHEIRNPLGSIKGAAQYLRSELSSGDHQRLLDVIIEEVDRLNSVVSQFLNYAKPYILNLKMHDVNQVIEKAISVIKASPRSENVVIDKELRTDLPFIEVDAEQLVQVILNVAFNAIEAMEGGGALIFRTSKINSGDGEAVGISIRDTGKGIKKEEMKNIFKPFFTTKERGVGLGLAISQKIIKHHGGHIKVKSIPRQGSIFYIRLGLTP
ncbi:MAG TPA: ATP-binding protein [Syntrophales bacterium]|nr:ATP-binding protein [Syntrophales bacterium]